MNKHKSKPGLLLILIICLLIIIIGITQYVTHNNSSAIDESHVFSEGGLTIANLNVGKADCAVLQVDDIVGMIDTGTYDAYSTIDSFLKDNSITEIDFLILTHYDQDHIGSAVKIISSYDVKNIYLADYVSQKEYYTGLMDCIKARENIYFVNENIAFNYNDISIDIYPASSPDELLSNSNNADNNMSLVCMITFGAKNFLFTGDIEKDRIEQVINDGYSLSADWIKMPHHGGYTKNTSDLLAIVDPDFAIISTSNERPAEEKLLDLLSSLSIKTYDTTYGTIITYCDKNSIEITQKSN
ncbi:Metal-dependent hydrolase, beta-lactamase superfamily II [Butyrivibrio proteoclasticus]|uniref:Metal-dependent hydrolase, beta-lactamase superfamily II n=1 Tax=Butyrivibrio proteoclasticus TaxID=43305 RepID=A0A1I5QFJ5_9FIRM|nr:MBL fold metallo-hydrolase [Butyrivibrio proteoclasticus]SFP45084.1 Metal-dependent hydrolase, beta-lactamase superfamily II [Butyrivibrio proteoclasticus]